MEKRFVIVYPEWPTDGANSGGISSREEREQFWRDNLDRYDQDLLDFISTAEVGAYLQSERGKFMFRTK